MNLNEATHTYASYSFAAYCEELTKQKRGKYFSESFDESDREAAFGPNNGCDACQGTGWVPVFKDDMDDPYRHLWVQAELDSPSEDGWHLVPCQKCSPVKDGLDEHIVKEGSKFVLKSKKAGKSLGEFDSKKQVREMTENPNASNNQKKVSHEKKVNTSNPDSKKDKNDDKDKGDKYASAAQRKAKSAQKRKQKEKERESKKLMPYEYASQKEAERAASHLGLHGSHAAGNGIYKPGSSEYSLRDAAHRKKEKQRMKGTRAKFHREEADGLSTGTGIANPEQVLRVVKRVVRGE